MYHNPQTHLRLSLFFVLFFALFFPVSGITQITIGDDVNSVDYGNPKEYEIGGITVSGVQFLDNNAILMITNLNVGEKIVIPGDKITQAIDKLWEQGLFENIKISITKMQGSIVFLDIYLQERPRLTKFSFVGIRKGEADKVKEAINISSGDVVTENLAIRSKNKIRKHFIDKGYLDVDVNVRQVVDTSSANGTILYFDIKKNKRIKVNKINFVGNSIFSDESGRRKLKNTKEKRFWRLFKSSKYIREDFDDDLTKIVAYYNELGYRDAKIERDSVYRSNKKAINIDIYVNEGRKYYFRNISWVGNTKYSSEQLGNILKIRKGDTYNQQKLEQNLSFNPQSVDVSSLYMDDGYLFFQAIPVEVQVDNDSIDIEIRIREGKQARINKVTIKGNSKTNDHVILREIRTQPGQLFSRSDIIRTRNELAQLRYFNQETIKPVPIPNPENGTVDIEYQVEETSSDQLELSGGWGGGYVVGTLGLSFNNFSARNFFKKSAWKPLPSGDGQKLSLRGQTNGKYYYSVSASFTEPWLGGKKPQSLSVSVYHSVQTNGYDSESSQYASLVINGITVGLGKRLKWPDDYFTIYHAVNLQRYSLKNYSSLFSFSDGNSNNVNYSFTIARNSIDAPIYPRYGSEISLTVQLTPPFSMFNKKNYNTISDKERYEWMEYHKWNFKSSWYFNLAGKFVLNTRARFGFLSYYDSKTGYPPFERFYVGGDGLSGYALDGRELIALRGYGNNTLTPLNTSSSSSESYVGGTVYDKYTVELRYPFSLNPSATIYGLAFMEGGNAWERLGQFNPFDMFKSVGVGVRVFLPMFGVLGLDWGYGFDNVPGIPGANKGQFHFSINQSIDQ